MMKDHFSGKIMNLRTEIQISKQQAYKPDQKKLEDKYCKGSDNNTVALAWLRLKQNTRLKRGAHGK